MIWFFLELKIVGKIGFVTLISKLVTSRSAVC
jgi:hypothetical protein